MTDELRGLIFDIQGYSVHDGPGCRTLVFMKGCPLRCEWCSNPEGIRAAQDIMFCNSKCVHRKNNCRRCLEVCPHKAIRINSEAVNADQPQLWFDRRLCDTCVERQCLRVCYFEGLRCCGDWKTVPELMNVLQRNRHYWGTSGGVTFSGGEPLLQHTYIQAVLQACRKERIHTAVETAAYCPEGVFLELMALVDFAFIDIKHMNTERHREKTGVSNERILGNIRALVHSGWPGRLVLRMPVIAGYNDSEENIAATLRFMQRLGLAEINILPFHRMGDSKWAQLGASYACRKNPATPETKLRVLQDKFLDQRIACYVGPDTLF